MLTMAASLLVGVITKKFGFALLQWPTRTPSDRGRAEECRALIAAN